MIKKIAKFYLIFLIMILSILPMIFTMSICLFGVFNNLPIWMFLLVIFILFPISIISAKLGLKFLNKKW
jgi:hypothetical protein